MDNSENNKDRNFGRVAVGHLTPATSQTFKSFISNMFHIMFHVTIIPSQMEVAPLHCSVDITQKRRLFKNTKETEKM